jgi:hypothetical protein
MLHTPSGNILSSSICRTSGCDILQFRCTCPVENFLPDTRLVACHFRSVSSSERPVDPCNPFEEFKSPKQSYDALWSLNVIVLLGFQLHIYEQQKHATSKSPATVADSWTPFYYVECSGRAVIHISLHSKGQLNET